MLECWLASKPSRVRPRRWLHFSGGLSIVEAQPAGTVWFAFRIGETTYGAFAAFAADEDREALLASGGPQLSQRYLRLFTVPPSFEKVDVLQTRLVTD